MKSINAYEDKAPGTFMSLYPMYKLILPLHSKTLLYQTHEEGKWKDIDKNVVFSWTRCLNTWLQLSGYTEPNIPQKALSEKKNTGKPNIFKFNPKSF